MSHIWKEEKAKALKENDNVVLKCTSCTSEYGHKRTNHITITNTNEINFDDKAWREKYDKKISELKRQKMQLQNQIEVYEVVFDELLKEKDPKEIDLKLRRSPRMKKFYNRDWIPGLNFPGTFFIKGRLVKDRELR